MPSVSVPKDFFVKERRIYGSWQTSFFRELIQNSVDAGCTTIQVSFTPVEGGCDLKFEDNGCGMSREVLDNVYFSLGKTTKSNSQEVGGFGRARILTCFSMRYYKIHTQDNLVIGDGGEYEVTSTSNRKGCLLDIGVDDTKENLLSALHSYLSACQLPCSVTVDGIPCRTWSYKRTLTRDLLLDDKTFAWMYVNKSASASRLLVRVNGTLMYSVPIRAKAQVILEIQPDISREVLTANRDGMTSKYQEVMNRFLQELAADTNSVLRPRFVRKNDVIKSVYGAIRTYSRHSKPQEDLGGHQHKEKPLGPSTEVLTNLQRVSSGAFGWDSGTGESSQASISTSSFREVGDSFVKLDYDVHIIDETDNPDIRKIISNYNPRNWIVCENSGKTYNKGGTIYKLLLLWQKACQVAVEALLASYEDLSQINWCLGWVFADEVYARCMKTDVGSALLLNPVDSNGKLAFSLRDKRDQKRLMAFAKHEAAHIVRSLHDEDYARTLTVIDSEYDEKSVFRMMSEVLSGEKV